MRIIMLTWEYPPRLVGGLARHVHDLSKALVRQGTAVEVVTCDHPGSPMYEDDEGVLVHRVTPDDPMAEFMPWVSGLNHAMARKGAELLAKDRAAILHAHDWLSAESAKELKHRFRVPLLATIHATESGRHGGISGGMQHHIAGLEWELTYEAWRVICCSHFMKDEISGALGCPRDKIDPICNGVIAEKFDGIAPDAAFRNRFARPEEKIVFFVGRMVQEKGVQILVGAAPRVLANCPEAKFVVVGGGYRDHLVDLVNYLGLSEKIHFAGFVDDETLLGIYKIASAAVFPSLYEPFGIVALEAMAAGVPVVVSDAGGLREVVDAGVTGVVTPAGSPDGLAYGILQILNNPGAGEKLAENASRKVRQTFNWNRIADQTRGVYDCVWEEYSACEWGK